jgi:hypothetical protein
MEWIFLALIVGVIAYENHWIAFSPQGVKFGPENVSVSQTTSPQNVGSEAAAITQASSVFNPTYNAQEIQKIGGIATIGGSLAGAEVATHGGLLGITSATTAATVVGAVISGIVLAASLIFHGADPNQVPAAKIEQTYEAIADWIQRLFEAGAIDKQTALALFNSLIQGAQQAEYSNPIAQRDPRPFKNGAAHAQMVINKYNVPKVQGAADVTPHGLSSTLANQIVSQWMTQTRIGSGGWYPDSVSNAKAVFDVMVNTLIQNGYPGSIH